MLKLRKTRGFESRPVTSSATKNLSAVSSKKIKKFGEKLLGYSHSLSEEVL